MEYEDRSPELANPEGEGEAIEVVEEVEGESGQPEKPKPSEDDELSDLFEVPQEDDSDIYCDDLLETDEEEDFSDLFEVSREDIMGHKPKPKQSKQVVRRRVVRRIVTPPTMGGVNNG